MLNISIQIAISQAMAKRKADDLEPDLAAEFGADIERGEKVEKPTRFKEKHSLDSDEEDTEAGKYDLMNEDDIEGRYPS